MTTPGQDDTSNAEAENEEWQARKNAVGGTRLRVSSHNQAASVASNIVGSSNSKSAITAVDFGMQPTEDEMGTWMNNFEMECSRDFEKQMVVEVQPGYHKTTHFAFLDITPFCRDATSAIVKDSFTQCFESKDRVRWDFEFYLLPLSYLSVVVRYCILLPVRICIVIASLVFFVVLQLISFAIPNEERRTALQLFGIKVVTYGFLWGMCAVIIEEGTVPPRQKGQIFVSNHSSVIDILLFMKKQPYSLTGQAYDTGTIAFFQKYVLCAMGNLWFDRMAKKDRKTVSARIIEHSNDVSKPPLLVFPEGTCVNNEHVVMFKRGAFELGTSIVPVAIKYNKIFVDGYWNSREQSFPKYLLRLFTSWALVAEVKYLDPQYKRPGEDSIQFATRVKQLIAREAGLNSTPWDGYLKYFSPRPEYKANRQKTYAKMVRQRFGLGPIPGESKETMFTTPEPTADSVNATASEQVNVSSKTATGSKTSLRKRGATGAATLPPP